jgi:hypothetical protein
MMSGCFAHVETRCPDCVVVDAKSVPRTWKQGTRRVFVLVPGMLGYGWEWQRPVARLERQKNVDFVIFAWDPWRSVDRAARDLAALLQKILAESQSTVSEVVVVAHSAAGIVAAHALGHVPPTIVAAVRASGSTKPAPPAKKLSLVTIGAPFAGMRICPCGELDVVHAPLMLSIAAAFSHYPAPPEGVEITEYVTSYPADPVMHPYWGKAAAPMEIGPANARRILVDPHFDHNFIVDRVVADLLSR